MQSLCGSLIRGQKSLNISNIKSTIAYLATNGDNINGFFSLKSSSSVADSKPQPVRSSHQFNTRYGSAMEVGMLFDGHGRSSIVSMSPWAMLGMNFASRSMTTVGGSVDSTSNDSPSAPVVDAPPRIKFKRLDKTAKHIMNILDKEAVEGVKGQREIPDIRPGYTVQLKVEVPENKRRVSTFIGTVIARRNAGINTTFRIRRTVAGVGVESLFPLYSPNIKDIKVLDKKKVRRAKLYYLRDRMKALKKR